MVVQFELSRQFGKLQKFHVISPPNRSSARESESPPRSTRYPSSIVVLVHPGITSNTWAPAGGYIGSQNSTTSQKQKTSCHIPVSTQNQSENTWAVLFQVGRFRWVGKTMFSHRCFLINGSVTLESHFSSQPQLQVFMAYLLLQPVVFRWLHCGHSYHSKC